MNNITGVSNLISIIKDLVTIFALITGGIWALWKWGFIEKIRKKKEILSIDGFLNFKIIEINQSQVIVSFDALWRNKGVFPIDLDCENSFLIGRKIKTESILNGPLNADSLDIKERLFHGKYIMEPQTDSIMQKQIVLSKNDTYLFEWIIGLDEKHAADFNLEGTIFCSREIVVNPEFELKKHST